MNQNILLNGNSEKEVFLVKRSREEMKGRMMWDRIKLEW